MGRVHVLINLSRPEISNLKSVKVIKRNRELENEKIWKEGGRGLKYENVARNGNNEKKLCGMQY